MDNMERQLLYYNTEFNIGVDGMLSNPKDLPLRDIIYILAKELYEKEQECEKLKKEIVFGSNGTLSDTIRATVFTDLSEENEEYKQALDEIEEYCKKDINLKYNDKKFTITHILDIIDKTKEQ